MSALRGMPEFRPYRYRGAGRDVLTGWLTEKEIADAIAAHEGDDWTPPLESSAVIPGKPRGRTPGPRCDKPLTGARLGEHCGRPEGHKGGCLSEFASGVSRRRKERP